MRIIAGTHRGTALATVGKGDQAAHLRPTSDRVRESLFNVLQGGRFGEVVRGARVLDLFAGTGALGLEALSRGASYVTFVDSGRPAQRLIAQNVARLARGADCTILTCAANLLPPCEAPCSLIFMDPPYAKSLGGPAILAAQSRGWIAKDAVVVWEEASAQQAPPGFEVRDQRRYGSTWITFLEAA